MPRRPRARTSDPRPLTTAVLLLCLAATACAGSDAGSQTANHTETDRMFTAEEERQLLWEIDTICADTWCEGDYNYAFDKLDCRTSTASCEFQWRFLQWIGDEDDIDDGSQYRALAQTCTIPVASRAQIAEQGPYGLTYTQDLYEKVSDCLGERLDTADAYFAGLPTPDADPAGGSERPSEPVNEPEAPPAGAMFTAAEESRLLSALHDICGDTWCGGDFDFDFNQLACSYDTQSCTFQVDFGWYTFDSEPEAEPAPYAATCIFQNITTREQIATPQMTYSETLYDLVSTCIEANEPAAYAFFGY